ncbi:MAG: polyprenyl diphosphate synthase [Bacilli bacterium]
MSKNNICQHVAFIMDGNGRWAKRRGLPRYLGHKEGCLRVIDIYEGCRENGIRAMSLYAFSTENWSRPKAEINHLFTYLEQFFKRELNRLLTEGAKIVVSGDISIIRERTRKVILEAIEKTKDNDQFYLNICLNYGGRDDIIRASKNFCLDVLKGKQKIEDLNEQLFSSYLYTKELPPIDLMIRTSGEQRLSNYLLYQLAYSELIFTKTAWPDFTKEELNKCLEEYKNRDRRYGGLSKDE